MLKSISILFVSVLFFVSAIGISQASFLTTAKTAEFTNAINNVSSTTYQTKTKSINDITAAIIQAVLGILGVIFIILMFLSGFKWMTADGNEEQVNKSKTTIINLIIGLAIVLAAFIITYSLSGILSKALLK